MKARKMILFLVYFVIFVTILVYLDMKKKQNFLAKLENVHSNYYPIIGNIHSFLSEGIDFLFKILGSAEPSLVFWIFSVPIYCTRLPEELQIIFLNKHTQSKGIIYKFLKPLRYSLVASDVELWRNHRRLLNKCFKQKETFDFLPRFNEFSLMTLDKLSPKMGVGELGHIIKTGFLNNFYGTLANFGTDKVNSLVKFDIYDILQRFEALALHRFSKPWLYPDFIFSRSDQGKMYKESMDVLSNNFIEIYDYMTEQKAFALQNNSGEINRQTFFDILLDVYNYEESESEMILFIIASEETSGSTLTAALILLGIYQDIQEKVYQEIIEIVGPDHSIDSSHITNLKYTEMVLNETLRLFPPVQQLMRQADTDIYLGGGKCIPKGTQIVVSIKEVHRDKILWKDPLKFSPDRFFPEEVKKRHPCAFIPFSYGSRNCIASKYAVTSMKVFLTNTLRKYRVISNCNSVEDILAPSGIFVKYPNNIEVKFEKR